MDGGLFALLAMSPKVFVNLALYVALAVMTLFTSLLMMASISEDASSY